MSKDLLLEIGTEEIPAHYMPSILGQVKDLAEKIRLAKRISPMNRSAPWARRAASPC